MHLLYTSYYQICKGNFFFNITCIDQPILGWSIQVISIYTSFCFFRKLLK